MHWTSKLKQFAKSESSLLKTLVVITVCGLLTLMGSHLGIKAFAYALVFYSLKGLAWIVVGSLVYMIYQKKSAREVYNKIPRNLLWSAITSIPLTAFFAMYYTLVPESVYQYIFNWGPWLSLVLFISVILHRVLKN